MSTNSRYRGSNPKSMEWEPRSVTKLAEELVDVHKPNLERRNLRIEMDVQPIQAVIDAELIRKALTGLIVNAIESTPTGGEITITTIDGIHQWEIEVADSSHSGSDNEVAEMDIAGELSNEDLPTLLPFPSNDHLRNAYRAAFHHDGQIQCWECPQGGKAYVLVIPRRRISKSA